MTNYRLQRSNRSLCSRIWRTARTAAAEGLARSSEQLELRSKLKAQNSSSGCSRLVFHFENTSFYEYSYQKPDENRSFSNFSVIRCWWNLISHSKFQHFYVFLFFFSHSNNVSILAYRTPTVPQRTASPGSASCSGRVRWAVRARACSSSVPAWAASPFLNPWCTYWESSPVKISTETPNLVIVTSMVAHPSSMIETAHPRGVPKVIAACRIFDRTLALVIVGLTAHVGRLRSVRLRRHELLRLLLARRDRRLAALETREHLANRSWIPFPQCLSSKAQLLWPPPPLTEGIKYYLW